MFAHASGAGSNAFFAAEQGMLKWVVVVMLLVLVTGLFRSELSRRLRLGRLPGDMHFRVRGRECHLPFTSTVLLSLLAGLILRVL
ncbi:MAG: DUF2905 family protein [Rhodocyclaceae bacterium]